MFDSLASSVKTKAFLREDASIMPEQYAPLQGCSLPLYGQNVSVAYNGRHPYIIRNERYSSTFLTNFKTNHAC